MTRSMCQYCSCSIVIDPNFYIYYTRDMLMGSVHNSLMLIVNTQHVLENLEL